MHKGEKKDKEKVRTIALSIEEVLVSAAELMKHFGGKPLSFT